MVSKSRAVGEFNSNSYQDFGAIPEGMGLSFPRVWQNLMIVCPKQ